MKAWLGRRSRISPIIMMASSRVVSCLRSATDGESGRAVELPTVVVATATVLRQRHDHAPTLRLVENRATRCKVHGSLLLDRGSDGVAFSQPRCLECLPAHKSDCAMGEAMALTQ